MAAVESRTAAALINGAHTDICVTPFEDRVLVVVSQTGTMGTMVLSTQLPAHSSQVIAELQGNDDGPRAYDTRICFGNYDDEMAEVCMVGCR